MYTLRRKLAIILCAMLLSGCASTPSIVAGVKIGMDREVSIRKILAEGSPTFYYLEAGSTEYVLFRNTPSFWAMYSDYPHTVEFLRLESDRVVDKGVVGKSDEKKIKTMRPDFVLREWQGKGDVPADRHDNGRQ